MKYFKFKNPDWSIWYCRWDSANRIKSNVGVKEFNETDIEEFAAAVAASTGKDEEECLATLTKDAIAYDNRQKPKEPPRK